MENLCGGFDIVGAWLISFDLLPYVLIATVASVIGIGIGASVTAASLTLLLRGEVRAIEYRMVEIVSGIMRDIDKTRGTPPEAQHPQVENGIARALLMQLGNEREKLDELTARAQHVLDGGRFDDSPTKWKKGKTL